MLCQIFIAVPVESSTSQRKDLAYVGEFSKKGSHLQCSRFRFLLGAGESANWPGAAKTVAEWFPKRESGWAVAIYDSGSAIGGAVAALTQLSGLAPAAPAGPLAFILGFLAVCTTGATPRQAAAHRP